MTTLQVVDTVPALPARGAIPGATFRVASRTSDASYRMDVHVAIDGVVIIRCSCPGADYRASCWHARCAAEIFETRGEAVLIDGVLRSSAAALVAVPDDIDIWEGL